MISDMRTTGRLRWKERTIGREGGGLLSNELWDMENGMQAAVVSEALAESDVMPAAGSSKYDQRDGVVRDARVGSSGNNKLYGHQHKHVAVG
ncbi:hypothetical protein PHYPSEUDO_009884 [Phytophthora pseudosyringae]|uniref:Uncharacterized protein n=1 Tax=Phytophthora pseudosyringae TaxID=221518 RepID=A0A8T1VC11_9STRA|nr:hypothetical protein PHYPSEUDO_009884 [Phytophthora pseudosyringae]